MVPHIQCSIAYNLIRAFFPDTPVHAQTANAGSAMPATPYPVACPTPTVVRTVATCIASHSLRLTCLRGTDPFVNVVVMQSQTHSAGLCDMHQPHPTTKTAHYPDGSAWL